MPAIVEGWLLGQAGGGAIADVLYGAVNPSGRLAETIPVRLADSPAYLDFPGEHSHVRYGEGLFVGYRWYDARDLEVSFPFGHGLSYTTFAYSDAAVSSDATASTVRVTVTNTGDRAGAEVVQVYTSLPGSAVVRAPRELKGFAKVALEAGETREVDGARAPRRPRVLGHPRRPLGRRGRRVRRRGRGVEPRHPRDASRSTSRATRCACRSRSTRRSAS